MRLLRAGGAFVVVEPTQADTPFRPGFEAWTATQPPRYYRENWERFWSRANHLLGYDHIELLGSRSDGTEEGTVADWIALLREAGFAPPDILWRDADEVMLGASKP